MGPMALRASLVRPRDSRLGRPGPGITSETVAARAGIDVAWARLLVRSRRVDRVNFAILAILKTDVGRNGV